MEAIRDRALETVEGVGYTSRLIPQNVISETIYALVLLTYVLCVVFATKLVYDALTRKGVQHNVAVYFNRKIIHMLAGGVAALLAPVCFTSPTLPLIFALILALMNYAPHRTGRLLYWYQVKENMYEVNFCLAWGIILALPWLFLGNPTLGLIPILFMSYGDAVTGIVRNLIYKRRTKSWWGNLAMFVVCSFIAYCYLSYWGILVAALASFVEHFEFGFIDDNVLISVSTLIALLLLWSLGLVKL